MPGDGECQKDLYLCGVMAPLVRFVALFTQKIGHNLFGEKWVYQPANSKGDTGHQKTENRMFIVFFYQKIERTE
jgi:hypothetical protein